MHKMKIITNFFMEHQSSYKLINNTDYFPLFQNKIIHKAAKMFQIPISILKYSLNVNFYSWTILHFQTLTKVRKFRFIALTFCTPSFFFSWGNQQLYNNLNFTLFEKNLLMRSNLIINNSKFVISKTFICHSSFPKLHCCLKIILKQILDKSINLQHTHLTPYLIKNKFC